MRISTPTMVIAASFLVAYATLTQTPENKGPGESHPNSAAVEKLRAIVEIRQSLLSANERSVRNGRGDQDGRHEIALAEAQLRLARELGQADAEMEALTKILSVQRQRLKTTEQMVRIGSVPRTDADLVRVDILETELRLLRARDASNHP